MMSLEPQILFREETDLYVDLYVRMCGWMSPKGTVGKPSRVVKQDPGKGKARGDPTGGVTSMSVEG